MLISDTGDSVLGGSGGDSTIILEAILRLGIKGRALVPMIDAESARQLWAAGVGATVTLAIGGRSTPLFQPIEVTGIVTAVADGSVLTTFALTREFGKRVCLANKRDRRVVDGRPRPIQGANHGIHALVASRIQPEVVSHA